MPYTAPMLIPQSTTRHRGAILGWLGLLSLASACAEGPGLEAVHAALASTPIPAAAKASIRAKIDASPGPFRAYLAEALADRKAGPMLLYRVDKAQALPEGYAPTDLVGLDGTALSVSRAGHRLRATAFRALKAMSAAAGAEGVTLLVSSAYRSYEYQVEVFARNAKEMGRAQAEMVSALPGHSQHQLGEAVDFGSITDAFAGTKASRWLTANARGYGFTLSFPKGMTEATGYAWESWHYRYIGKAAAALEGEYFDGLQRYLLMFLDELH
jgi:zinc D-Ala-D-Ala carboxypeptidase